MHGEMLAVALLSQKAGDQHRPPSLSQQERTMSNDIKPDTSLYTDTVDKLRAIAAVIEAKRAGNAIEWKKRDGSSEWQEAGPSEPSYVDVVLLEYRIQPKPREVWILQHERDGLCMDAAYMYAPPPAGGYKAIRFVEVME
jgi:hypothetical protein